MSNMFPMPRKRNDISPDHRLPIPRGTKSRDSKTIDACVLYLYGDPETGRRITEATDLAVITGGRLNTIQSSRTEDKWEDFRLNLIADRMEQKGNTLSYFQRKRTDAELKRIENEKVRQINEIPKLEMQAEAILDSMRENPPGSKLYPGLVTALDRITKMLDERTGKAEQEQEVLDMHKALIKVAASKATNENKQKQLGRDHALVIDELPD